MGGRVASLVLDLEHVQKSPQDPQGRSILRHQQGIQLHKPELIAGASARKGASSNKLLVTRESLFRTLFRAWDCRPTRFGCEIMAFDGCAERDQWAEGNNAFLLEGLLKSAYESEAGSTRDWLRPCRRKVCISPCHRGQPPFAGKLRTPWKSQ